jgi:uracil-DNA glycosylase family 4
LSASFQELENAIASCRLCPRLVSFREELPPRASFRSEKYWRKPVPGFGDPNAWLMLLGLAPAAHGANRTGRVFTGDESAKFLIRVLYAAGFANQPTSLTRDDGLKFKGCYITAAVKCVPPDNRPTPKEFDNCSCYLNREFELMKNLSAVVTLGQLAFRSFMDFARMRGASVAGIKFSHGAHYEIEGLPRLYCSYHPSPQNTYTKKLTKEMLLSVFERAKSDRLA